MKKSIIFGMIIVSSTLFSEEGASVKPNECKGPVLCPSYPIYGRNDDCSDYRWHLNLGLLYQQPWMSNMGAGTVDLNEDINISGNVYHNATSTYLEECFNYSLGLTAGIGYFIEHDNWFFLTDFDWISSSIKNQYSTAGAIYHMMGFINPSISQGLQTFLNNWTSLQTAATLNIYDLNFKLSRGSFHSKCFSLEPIAGVKALWYNGSYTRRAYGEAVLLSPSAYVQTDQKLQSWGVGPTFGLNGEYFFTENFSLFSDNNIAVLYGKIDTNSTSLFFNGTINNDTNGIATYVQNFNQPYFVPFRTILGLKFGSYCLENQHYIALKVGYDARYIIGDSGLSGDVGTVSFVPDFGTAVTTSIMPNRAYNIAANGLYVNFIWEF